MSPVLFSRQDGVGVITLNRPKALNALSQDLMRSLDALLDEIAVDEYLRALIVTGAGAAFSAGGDLVEFAALLKAGPAQLLAALRYNQNVLEKLESLPFPVIAAVNGVAVAGGLELVLCCDIVLAAEGAKLGDGHARYAIIPAGGATARLSRRIPASVAAHLFYSAELFSAQNFLAWGLVNEVMPLGELVSRAMVFAHTYAGHSRYVLAAMKRLMQRSMGPAAKLAQGELDEFAQYVESVDLFAGLNRFTAKAQGSGAEKQ
jgi:enoyl-CoA hydratase/carnithine racemase